MNAAAEMMGLIGFLISIVVFLGVLIWMTVVAERLKQIRDDQRAATKLMKDAYEILWGRLNAGK